MKSGDHNSRLHLDGRVLAKFLFSLNVARHHGDIYPEKHPLVVRSLQQVADLLRELLRFEESLVLGIARDRLLVGPEVLDPRNAIYRDLAGSLFSCDIAAVVFRRSLPSHELWEFLQGVRLGREGLREDGGISSWLCARGIVHLEVRPIDYLSFTTTDEAVVRSDGDEREHSAALWISFVEGMMRGTKGSESPFPPDPEAVARILNERTVDAQGGSGEESYERAIASFLQQIDREDLDNRLRREPLEKLNAFFSRLVPRVRRKFLSSTFRHLEGRRDLAKSVLGAFSESLVLQTLEEIEEETISVPPLILELLGQFSAHGHKGDRLVAAPGLAGEECKTRLRTLFREDCSERFVTPEYLRFLERLQTPFPATARELSWTQGMARTLESHALEKQLCAVVLQIRQELPDGETEPLQTNLADLIDFFLRRGDLSALVETHDRLAPRAAEEGCDADLARRGLALYRRPEFIEAIVSEAQSCCRSRLPQIQALIATVGSPFVEPLLERLAAETEMSRRRFWIDALVRLRQAVVAPICARLRDRRWYFVRNLVVILRTLGDPAVLEALERIVGYPHAKVQIEVMRTFHYFCDARGDRQLMAELESRDPERRARAVQAARWSFTPEVLARLAEMLSGSFDQEEYPVKSALVRTLAEIGSPLTIAPLSQFLQTRSFFHRATLRRLKAEAVEALRKYPSEAGGSLLHEVARSGFDETAELAAHSLGSLPAEGS